MFNSLYKSLYGCEYDSYTSITHPYNISLIEVRHSTNEELVIRGFGSESIEEIYKRHESIKEQQIVKKNSEPKSFFERMFGISYDMLGLRISLIYNLHLIKVQSRSIRG